MKTLRHIEGTCHDFDGVFYNTHHIPDYDSHLADIFAETLCSIVPKDIHHEDARRLAIEGYPRYGDSLTALMIWTKEQGLDGEEIRRNFFRDYHKNIFKYFVNFAPTVFARTPSLIEAFQKIKGHIKNGIATHGCPKGWTLPLLPQMGLSDFIEKDAVLGLEDSQFRKKSTHPDLVEMCLAALNIDSENAAYTEDTPINLETAKQAMPKLTTIFFHHGRPLASKPAYIDHQFKDMHDYLTALHTARTEPRKLILL